MRAQLPAGGAEEVLCGSTQNSAALDESELAAWSDWSEARLSVKAVLGEALAAAAAWQCVAACDLLARNRFKAANVSVVGLNQQAIGARFLACAETTSPTV
jgi:hypothetical protein